MTDEVFSPQPQGAEYSQLHEELSRVARRLSAVEKRLGIVGEETPRESPASRATTAPIQAIAPQISAPTVNKEGWQKDVTISVPAFTAMPLDVEPTAKPASVPMASASQKALLQNIAQVAASDAPANVQPKPATQIAPTSTQPSQATASFHVATTTQIPNSAPNDNNPKLSVDWENIIGGKWALWAGCVSLFLAVAYFMALTWKSAPPPPWVRVAMGLAVGAGLLGAGAFFRQRVQTWFSEGLMGVGLAVVYLSIWAGAQYFKVIPSNMALLAMSLTTAMGVALAVRYNALSLNVLAVLGGFVTPVVLQAKGGGHSPSNDFGLLAYVAVLNAGILTVSLFKRWRGTTWLSLVGTLLLVSLWSLEHYSDSLRWITFTFVTLYFALFLGVACFDSLLRREQTQVEDLILLFTSTAFYALSGYAILESVSRSFPSAFLLALMIFFAVITTITRAQAPENKILRASFLALSLFFLTIATPVQLHGSALAIGWILEAGMLLLLGHRLKAELLMRAGQIVWVLSFWPVFETIFSNNAVSQMPFLNQGALTLLFAVLTNAVLTWNVYQQSKSSSDTSTQKHEDEVAPLYAIYAILGGAWLFAEEVFNQFYWHKFPSEATWDAAALYTIAALIAVYAVAIFALGIRMRHATMRMTALALGVASAALPLWISTAYATAQWPPFWNFRWIAFLVIAACMAKMAKLISRAKDELPHDEWEALGNVSPAATLFVLAALTLETYFGFAHGATNHLAWRSTACFYIATLWSCYALLLLFLGTHFHQKVLRLQAYGIGAVGIVVLTCNALGWIELSTVSNISAPILNLRFISFIAITTTLATATYVINSFGDSNHMVEAETAFSGVVLCGGGVLLFGLSQEIYATCRFTDHSLGAHWRQFAMFTIATVWQLFAVALLWFAFRFAFQRKIELFARVAQCLSVLAVSLLCFTSFAAVKISWTPLLNARFSSFVAFAILLGTLSWLSQRHKNSTDNIRNLFSFASILAPVLLLWCTTQEAFETCYFLREAFGAHWDRWAQMSISLVWSLFGAALLITGIHFGWPTARQAALGLLALTVAKVFLFDLSFLDAALRVLSLGGLGGALLFISWLYSRYGAGKEEQDERHQKIFPTI